MALVEKSVLSRQDGELLASVRQQQQLLTSGRCEAGQFIAIADDESQLTLFIAARGHMPLQLQSPPDDISALSSVGSTLLVGDVRGRLWVYSLDAAAWKGYTRAISAIGVRPSPILAFSFGFERHLFPAEHVASPGHGVDATGGLDPLEAVLEAMAARQVLDTLWVLHANGEVVSMSWAEICNPIHGKNLVAGDDGGPTSTAVVGRPVPSPLGPPHVRWTLNPPPKALHGIAILNPPVVRLFTADARSWCHFGYARDTGAGAGFGTGARGRSGGGHGGHGRGDGGNDSDPDEAGDDSCEPSLVLVTCGSGPPLAAYSVPIQRSTATLTEMAQMVSENIESTAKGLARQIKAFVPTPVKRGLVGGLTRLGAGGLVSALSAWMAAPDQGNSSGSSGGASGRAGASDGDSGQDEEDEDVPLPAPAAWTGTVGGSGAQTQADGTASGHGGQAGLSPAEGRDTSTDIPVLQSQAAPPRIVDQELDFPDKDRIIRTAVPDPTGRYLIAVDAWGRVLLFGADASPSLVLLRMRKGHRDAQVGWLLGRAMPGPAEQPIPSSGENSSTSSNSSSRLVLYWIVYSPNRGTLDVWAGIYGPRVASLKVGRHARLLYSPGCLMTMRAVPGAPSSQAGGPGPQGARVTTGPPACFIIVPVDQQTDGPGSHGQAAGTSNGSGTTPPAAVATPLTAAGLTPAGQAGSGTAAGPGMGGVKILQLVIPA